MKNWKVLAVFFVCVLSSYSSQCQNLKREELKSLTDEKFNVAFTNLHHFLKLQNDGNYPEQIDQNKEWCDSVFRKLNFKTQTIKTEGAPLLFAEKIYNKNYKNILFYLQIDGQPVDISAWSQPDPFEPRIQKVRQCH